MITHFAYVFAAQAQQQSPSGNFSSMILMIGILVFLFWIILIKPQKRQEQERKKMLSSLQKGDKVISIGGIHGIIVDIDENGDIVTVEVAKNIRMDFTRSAVSQIVKKKKQSS